MPDCNNINSHFFEFFPQNMRRFPRLSTGATWLVHNVSWITWRWRQAACTQPRRRGDTRPGTGEEDDDQANDRGRGRVRSAAGKRCCGCSVGRCDAVACRTAASTTERSCKAEQGCAAEQARAEQSCATERSCTTERSWCTTEQSREAE